MLARLCGVPTGDMAERSALGHLRPTNEAGVATASDRDRGLPDSVEKGANAAYALIEP